MKGIVFALFVALLATPRRDAGGCSSQEVVAAVRDVLDGWAR